MEERNRPQDLRSLYMDNVVDLHSHIIPEVDDGAQSVEEALELLRLDHEQGISHVFATPHYGEENGFAPTRHEMFSGYRWLENYLRITGSPVKISLGTEWYCSEEIVERIRREEAFPMNDSGWYMVEFLEYGSVSEPAEVIFRRLAMMRREGINTILAHPERYTALQKDWDLAKRICDLGVLLQVNAYDLYLNPHEGTRNLAQWMAKEHMISFLGSDMHGIRKGKKAPKLQEGIRWLYDNVDEEYANDVARRNAEKLLGVEPLAK